MFSLSNRKNKWPCHPNISLYISRLYLGFPLPFSIIFFLKWNQKLNVLLCLKLDQYQAVNFQITCSLYIEYHFLAFMDFNVTRDFYIYIYIYI